MTPFDAVLLGTVVASIMLGWLLRTPTFWALRREIVSFDRFMAGISAIRASNRAIEASLANELRALRLERAELQERQHAHLTRIGVKGNASQKASRKARDQETRRRYREIADKLAAQPLRPRDEVVAGVREERQRRINSEVAAKADALPMLPFKFRRRDMPCRATGLQNAA